MTARALGAALIGALAATCAHAQQQEELPGTVLPGIQPDDVPALLDLDAFSVIVELPGGDQPPPQVAREVVRVEGLRIRGAETFTPGQLTALFDDELPGDVTLKDLFGFAHRIEEHYRARGYILSYAYLPPQDVADGVFEIQVVEGAVTDVTINAPPALKRLIRGVLGDAIAARPFKLETLERALLILNRRKGLEGSATFTPPENAGPGEVEMVVDFDHQPASFYAAIDNHGSKIIGRHSLTAAASANQPFGLGENFTLIAAKTPATDEGQAIVFGVNSLLGTSGLAGSARVTVSETRPGAALKTADIQSQTVGFDAQISYPVVIRRYRELLVDVSFAHRNTRTSVADRDFTSDRTNVVSLRARGSIQGPFAGATQGSLSLSQGVPIFGDSTDEGFIPSRAGATYDFTTFNASIAALQPVWGPLRLRADFAAQYAFGELPAGREFGVGGPTIGRGFDRSAISGEHGVAASFEVQAKLSIDQYGVDGVTPYGFYDVGRTWDKTRPLGADGPRDLSIETIASAGLGVSAAFLDGLIETDLEVARTLSRDLAGDDGNDETRILFEVAVDY